MSSGAIQAREMTQSIKCFPQKGKDLNLTPRTFVKILGMVVCIPALERWKQEKGPLELAG